MNKPNVKIIHSACGWRAMIEFTDGSLFLTAWHHTEMQAQRAAAIYIDAYERPEQ